MRKFEIFRKPSVTLFQSAVIDLKQTRVSQPGYRSNYGSVEYEIYLHHTDTRVGYIDLRFGESEELYYAGNIGYRILEGYRGNGYAYEACLLVLQIAKSKYGLSSLWITCSPDNIASKKTIEKLGGILLECAQVPSWHWLAQRGENIKNIYRFKL